MAQIQALEFGTLSEYQRSDSSPNSGRYFRLQIWQDGKNQTCHVRPEEHPTLRQALEVYARLPSLAQLSILVAF